MDQLIFLIKMQNRIYFSQNVQNLIFLNPRPRHRVGSRFTTCGAFELLGTGGIIVKGGTRGQSDHTTKPSSEIFFS